MIDPKVQEAIERARSEYDAMTPVDRELIADDQRRSWVRGETGTDPGPHVLAAEVRRLRSEIAARERAAREKALREAAAVVCPPSDPTNPFQRRNMAEQMQAAAILALIDGEAAP